MRRVFVVILVAMLLLPVGRAVSVDDRVDTSALITYDEAGVGICYPYLILEHSIVDLRSGEKYFGTGGDIAKKVYCGSKFFVVEGESGIYVFSRASGLITKAIPLNKNMTFLGISEDTIGIYDNRSRIVFIKNLETDTDFPVKLDHTPYKIAYSLYKGVPIVAYSVNATNTGKIYYVSIAGETLRLNYRGSGAVFVEGDRIFVESNGVVILRLYEPLYRVRIEDFIPLPFTITDFENIVGGYLFARFQDVLIRINVNANSTKYKTFSVIGASEVTNVGYYVKETDTTYVVMPDGIYTVIGKATGRLGDLILTNIGGKAVFYPLHPVNFVTAVDIEGLLYPRKAEGFMKVKLRAGEYKLPKGGTLKVGGMTLLLDRPEVVYPPVEYNQFEPVESSTLKTVASYFPRAYTSIEEFNNTRGVYAGGGYVILLSDNKATIYSPYGVTAEIPGAWKYAGGGDCIVLYDGSTFMLYDPAGNPIKAVGYYLIQKPLYISCAKVQGDYIIRVYYSNRTYTISDKGISSESTYNMFADPTGLSFVNGVLEYGTFKYQVPPNAEDIVLNKYYASWRVGENVWVLALPDDRLYTFVNVSKDLALYPVNEDYLIVLNRTSKIARVIAYKSWLVDKAFVRINTYSDAEVYVNDKYVGKGPTTIYTKSGDVVKIEVKKKYYKPITTYIRVPRGGTTINLYPELNLVNVTLSVRKPKEIPVESVYMRINGNETIWKVNTSKEFIAGVNYRFEILGFSPADVCEAYSFNKTFTGNDTLVVECRLTSSVLALSSRVDATVMVYKEGSSTAFAVLTIKGNTTEYLPVEEGVYRVVSTPQVKGYTKKVLNNVTVPHLEIVTLDVTPLPLGELRISVTPPIANVTVTDSNGTIVCSEIATQPITLKLQPGNYTVSATAPDFVPYEQTIEVRAGSKQDLNITLTPVPAPSKPPKPPVWKSLKFRIVVLILVVAGSLIAFYWRKRKEEEIEEITTTEKSVEVEEETEES